MKALNLSAFAAGFYLVTHDSLVSGNLLPGGAIDPDRTAILGGLALLSGLFAMAGLDLIVNNSPPRH